MSLNHFFHECFKHFFLNIIFLKYKYYYFKILCFLGVTPHDIVQPELTMPCHKNVKFSDILRELLTLTQSWGSDFLFVYLFIFFHACWSQLWFGRQKFYMLKYKQWSSFFFFYEIIIKVYAKVLKFFFF